MKELQLFINQKPSIRPRDTIPYAFTSFMNYVLSILIRVRVLNECRQSKRKGVSFHNVFSFSIYSAVFLTFDREEDWKCRILGFKP